MTDQEKDATKVLLSRKHLEAMEQAEDAFEKKMLEAKYKKNIEKVEQGINPFDKPDNSSY
jgi:hypothetical protein